MNDRIRSALEALRPSVYPDALSRAAFTFQLNLAESEWFAPERQEQDQLNRLKMLALFASRQSPYWRARLDLGAVTAAARLADALTPIPILSRAEIIAKGEALRTASLPPGHVAVGELKTSGSTGAVVSILTTDIALRLQGTLTVRAHLWAGRDLSRSIAIIRRFPRGVAEFPNAAETPYWDGPLAFPFPTGHGFQLNTHNASLEQQWDWLARMQPAYLLTYPSVLRGFAERITAGDAAPIPLESIATISEVVDTELREAVSRNLGAPIYDLYSSQEAGSMAVQCPDNACYHIQSEAVILEILDEQGRPCAPGEIGRVVVTPLYNYATPLFRYEIGDYAEAGALCACGRGLPVLNRVAGRRRNLLRTADGRTYWPSLGARYMQKVVPFREHQFRQTDLHTIEVMLATDAAIDAAQENELRRIVAGSLPGPFDIRISRVDAIPRPASGKHEEFVSLLG